MRGQPERLSRSYRRRNSGNAIVYGLISFHSTDVLCTLSRLFVLPGFHLFCVHLTVHFLAAYSILGSSIKQSLTGGNGNEYNGCVSLRYNSLFISLPLFAKGHKNNNVEKPRSSRSRKRDHELYEHNF